MGTIEKEVIITSSIGMIILGAIGFFLLDSMSLV